MNQTLFSFFYSFAHQSSALDATIVFVAKDLIWVILVALFFYLLRDKEWHQLFRTIVLIFGSAGVAVGSAILFKDLFHTVRPFIEFSWVQPLISESGFAFPSGHTTLLSALAAASWFEYKKASITLGILAVIVGISRIMVGVHWPIDIAGGLVIGSIISIIAYRIGDRLLPKVKKSLY